MQTVDHPVDRRHWPRSEPANFGEGSRDGFGCLKIRIIRIRIR
jgi:hypothetical protein